MKLSSARIFIFMQIKVIFIRMVSHLHVDSFETEAQGNSEMAYSEVIFAVVCRKRHA